MILEYTLFGKVGFEVFLRHAVYARGSILNVSIPLRMERHQSGQDEKSDAVAAPDKYYPRT